MKKNDLYDPKKEMYDLGAVLVAAVFEAIRRVFNRKTETLRKIAALAPGARDHLIELLTREARDLAGQFLNIIIRAIDYCPPMDLTFGEFLRALVTADYVRYLKIHTDIARRWCWRSVAMASRSQRCRISPSRRCSGMLQK